MRRFFFEAVASRVILGTEVATGARHDNQPYLGQLQRIRERCQIAIREATADRNYGSAAIIRALQGQGITTYIPLWSGRVGNSKYLKGELVYDKTRDRLGSPAPGSRDHRLLSPLTIHARIALDRCWNSCPFDAIEVRSQRALVGV